jgi:hypothetical protein
MESINADNEANKIPFSQCYQKEKMKMDQEVQKMMWEIRRLPEIPINDNKAPIKAKKQELFNV